MNNQRSFPPPSIIFAIGAIIGLAFGLWIGWGLWPVEWEGATLRDLDQSSRAEYIAAVADAFVIYDTPEAAANARQRLSALEGDFNTEFVNAIRYFEASNQPEHAIRISNIGRLANSLGLVPPDLQSNADTIAATAAVDNTNTNPVNPETDASQGDITSSAGSSTGSNSTGNLSWTRWLLWLLAALLLLSGSVYLMAAAGLLNIQQITERIREFTSRESSIDEFEDEDYANQHQRYDPLSQQKRPISYVSESEDLAFDDDEDHGQWPPDQSSEFFNQRQERDRTDWYGDNRRQDYTSSIDDDHATSFDEYRRDPRAYQTDEADNRYAGTFVMDSDEIDLEADDTIDSFAPEPQEAYDRFYSEEEEAHPAHFMIESLGNRESAIFEDTHTPLIADDEEKPRVQTIDQLMATEHRPTVPPVQKPILNDKTNDTDEDDEAWPEHDSLYDSLPDEAEEIEDDLENDLEDEFEEDFGEEVDDTISPPFGGSAIDDSAARLTFRREDLGSIDLDAFRRQQPSRPQRPAPRENRSPQGATPTKRPPHQLIDQHTLSYQMGIAEYDESKPIVDPDLDKYIGEFGMGTSEKNGVVLPNGDYVAALEVWLFDKSDEKNMGNQTRILLSEYAVDHNLEQVFTKERTDNPRPFTPQPGVYFQLESQNLLLNCTIVDVKYLESGPGKGMFGSVRVDMSVHKKS